MSDKTLHVSIDGTTHAINLDDFDGMEARAFREEFGCSMAFAFARISSGELDALEVYAGLVWLVLRRDDASLKFTDVLPKVTMKSVLDEAESEEPPPPPG